MDRSFFIGQYRGIPVKVHWSFGLMIMAIFFIGIRNGNSLIDIGIFFLLIFTLFACVIFHEFGHALMAKKYSVTTRDIIISPIGGVARLERIPTRPMDEFWIAVAGPLVNVVLAFLCAVVLFAIDSHPFATFINDDISLDSPSAFLQKVFFINIILFLFNLLPAFPMDGGRVMRALLSLRYSRKKATKIAMILGKVFAILFIIAAILIPHYILGFIGMFIFYMADSEYKSVKVEELLKETTASQIMNQSYTSLYPQDPMSKAIDVVENGKEKSFLVFNLEDKPVGCLHYQFIKDAERRQDTASPINDYLSTKLHFVSSSMTIQALSEFMQNNGLSVIGVKDDGSDLLGIIDRNTIIDFISNHK